MELGASRYVESGEWLVEEDDLGIRRESARERSALFHSARELVGKLRAVAVETNAREELVGESFASRTGNPTPHERIDDVLTKREPRKERAVLKDDRVSRRRRNEQAVLRGNGASHRTNEPGERGQQRGFSDPGRSDDREHLAARQIERHVAHHGLRRAAMSEREPAHTEKREIPGKREGHAATMIAACSLCQTKLIELNAMTI